MKELFYYLTFLHLYKIILHLYHVRYFSHLTLQVGSSNWVNKTQIHSIQRWHHFGTITSWSAFLLEKRLHPLLYWIWYSWSRSTHILYYINLSVRWNSLHRNQISSCQHVFYYILINLSFFYFFCFPWQSASKINRGHF